jgi:hypothetical protein
MDPRYKCLSFLSSAQRKKAEEYLEGLIDEMPLKKLTVASGSDTPPSKRQRRPTFPSESSTFKLFLSNPHTTGKTSDNDTFFSEHM